jgi:hypothetical protein
VLSAGAAAHALIPDTAASRALLILPARPAKD